MNVIIDNKWLILIGLEVLAWSSTFFMLYARYGMESQKWFRFGAVLLVLTGVVPQLALGVFNFIRVGEIDNFTIVLLAVIIYGATIGKKDVKKLDEWMKKKFSKESSRPID